MITIDEVKEFKKIGTHSGSFHADDVFCAAFLKLVNNDLVIVRSRDNDELSTCDFIFDVSIDGVYNMYDHHGVDRVYRTGKDDYIAYSAFGLVWRDLGLEYLSLFIQDEDLCEKAWRSIDYKIVRGIDAEDNGVKLPGEILNICEIISALNSNWNSDKPIDESFSEAVELAKIIFKSFIDREVSRIAARDIVRESYEKSQNGRRVLKQYAPWASHLIAMDIIEKVKLVVYPGHNNEYKVEVVKKEMGSFESRMDLPLEWAGKRNDDLVAVTGVEDAIFCHPERFIAAAKTFAGAIKLAKLAIAYNEK